MYKLLIRPLLFWFPPERIHHWVFDLLKVLLAWPGAKTLARAVYGYQSPRLAQQFWGLHFPNPVGLAAGFDKDARLIDELACLGFGFIEIGTLTPRPQPGNPPPRLFRLPQDQALINRLGFNNGGVAAAVARLRRRRSQVLVGGNLGKNKDTPNQQAQLDYEKVFAELYPVVDYFVVNVSSPNTPGLRELQEKEPLTALLKALKAQNLATGQPKPLLLKIAPDLTNPQLDDIVDIVQTVGIDGLIATNTTIARDGLLTPAPALTAIGAGGLSGQPLRHRATEVICYLRQRLGPGPVIVGVGGIYTAADAIEKLQAGANLLQLYTGFVYEGPGVVKRINRGLDRYYQSHA
ncbi:MAG: quinone-dependent dihydroorotate dehydrogenase [Bernardetiaceae bacterium]|jgi:dihydroorotate dehydrogenase|nr:quinone-dependent dihydroorotate dehydrogenase [Bernardetiaceae bacterium]